MGEQNPQRKGNCLKTFHLTNYSAEIQDTRFGLWIRDVATHLLKKTKQNKGRCQESDCSKIPMTQTLVEMTLMAQQGRGEHVSGEEELPSVTC